MSAKMSLEQQFSLPFETNGTLMIREEHMTAWCINNRGFVFLKQGEFNDVQKHSSCDMGRDIISNLCVIPL